MHRGAIISNFSTNKFGGLYPFLFRSVVNNLFYTCDWVILSNLSVIFLFLLNNKVKCDRILPCCLAEKLMNKTINTRELTGASSLSYGKHPNESSQFFTSTE
ncbi:hypothetical protein [Calothrix rhizosoleniae]|uniref:hypothetical protein n=1 Tax=Calothrix rhizosoleniae TaxID=888997 RepID=UPI000B49C051|nr:hypothetical protein [Calothrix rhizosoleniae]